MITLLFGENTFAQERALRELIAAAPGVVERYDGETLTREQLPSLLQGVTLFSSQKVVVIRRLSHNTELWPLVPTWNTLLDESTQIVLVETKLDKRSKTYKALKPHAVEYALWTERDTARAAAWVQEEAVRQGAHVTPAQARRIVQRAGVDHWALFHAVAALSVLDTIHDEAIDDYVETTPHENVFAVFECALRGDEARLKTMLAHLQSDQDPYQFFGLLASQAAQLLALAAATMPTGEVARQIGAHPFVLGKLEAAAKHRGLVGVRRIVALLAAADVRIKTVSSDPWQEITGVLLVVAAQHNTTPTQ